MRSQCVILLALLLTRQAAAQDGTPVLAPCASRPTVQQAFDQATLVILGSVLGATDQTQQLVTGTSRRQWRMHQVVLRVVHGWKGEPRDTVIIHTAVPDDDSAAARFEPGELYLLYLHSPLDAGGYRRDSTAAQIAGLLWNHPQYLRCSRTTKLSVSSEDLHFLGQPRWVRQ